MTPINTILKEALLIALEGETNAVHKYTTFAHIAKKEGFPNVEYLFLALVEAEQVHIKNHQNALGEKPSFQTEKLEPKSTLENVKNAYEAEWYETKQMYPDLRKKIKTTRKEQDGKVTDLSLEWAEEVEMTHAQILQQALVDLKKGKDFQVEKLFVCRVCGNLRLIESDEICPVCGHDAKFYKLIDHPKGE